MFLGKVSVRIAAENGVRLVVEFASGEQVGDFIMELRKAINSTKLIILYVHINDDFHSSE